MLFAEQEATQDNFTDLTGNFHSKFVFISWPDLLKSWKQENHAQCKVKYHFLFMLLCFFLYMLMSVYPMREGSTIFRVTGVQFFQIEKKPERRFSADTNLKRFQHKVL